RARTAPTTHRPESTARTVHRPATTTRTGTPGTTPPTRRVPTTTPPPPAPAVTATAHRAVGATTRAGARKAAQAVTRSTDAAAAGSAVAAGAGVVVVVWVEASATVAAGAGAGDEPASIPAEGHERHGHLGTTRARHHDPALGGARLRRLRRPCGAAHDGT